MEQNTNIRSQLPEGLENIIKTAVKEAFVDHPKVNTAIQKLKIQCSNIADYQINCRGIASFIGMKDKVFDIATKIKENISMSSPIIKKIEADNGFLNIFTNESRPMRCTCKIKTNVGEQDFHFASGQNILYSNLKQDLTRQFLEGDLELRQRMESTTTDVILQNFKVHMGANFDLTDVEEAVESVTNRDYPELNHLQMPPIFVPKLFLASHPQAIDMDLYPEELERQKKELESQTDLIQAKELKAIQKRNPEFESTDEQKEILKKLNDINKLDGKIKRVRGDRAEKKLYNFLEASLKNEEVVVVNNFKIMTLQDLDKIAEDKEKDFVVFNLTKRYIMSLEVKSSCNKSSLSSSRRQISDCLDVISKWCGADLSRENGWKFFSVIFFEENVQGHKFCCE